MNQPREGDVMLASSFRWIPPLPKDAPTYVGVVIVILIVFGYLIGRSGKR